MTLKALGLALAGMVASTAVALAQGAAPKPAIVYDLGGKFDKSFNEGVYTGAERFKKETGVEYRDFEPQNDAQREQALRRFAREGFSPILAVGFSQKSALEKVAAEFPNLKFAIIDSVVEKPNVESILFKEHEGSYLVGMIAARESKTGVLGFVGGMDIPLIHRFFRGYEQGAKAVNPQAEVIANYVGVTDGAWNNPDGRTLALRRALAAADGGIGATLLLLNADGTGRAFALPKPKLDWTLVLDSAHPDREERPVQDEAVPVGPRSVVLLSAKLPPA